MKSYKFFLQGALSRYLYSAVILLAFIPILSPQGLSINFSFLILLFISPFVRLDLLPAYVPLIIISSLLSFFYQFFFFTDFETQLARQFLSFSAYMAFLSILLIRIRISIDEIFNILVIVSSVYAIFVIYNVALNFQYVLSDFRSLKVGLREYVTHWPQRFPVVILAAFFFTLIKLKESPIYLLAAAILACCLFLTFTRAIYLSMGVSFVYLGARFFLKSLRSGTFIIKVKSIIYFLIIICFLSILNLKFPFLKVFLELATSTFDALVDFFGGNIISERLSSSESQRLYHWQKTLSIWIERPLFGTGFLGIYNFTDLGSTHSQYLDVLLKTGLFGLSLYLLIWFKLVAYYIDRPEVVSGLIAIFVFGFMHETTKLSYTGLLFVLLASKMFEEKRAISNKQSMS